MIPSTARSTGRPASADSARSTAAATRSTSDPVPPRGVVSAAGGAGGGRGRWATAARGDSAHTEVPARWIKQEPNLSTAPANTPANTEAKRHAPGSDANRAQPSEQP